MSWYRTGTVAVTNGSKIVTGAGTLWTTAVNVGDAFALVDANLNPTGAWYEVEAVVSNTELTLKQSYAGETGSNKMYCVFNLVGNMTTPSFAQRLATFFANFQTLLDQPTSIPTALGIPIADENGNIADGWISKALDEMSVKADLTYVDAQLALKADASDVEDELALKANTADVTASVAGAVPTTDVAVTAAANKIPKADALGKIDPDYLPDATLPVIATGDAGKVLSVNSTEDGLEYTSLPEGTLPTIAGGDAGKLLAVNVTEDGYEWITPAAASDALNAPYEAVEEHGTISVDTTIAASDGNIHTLTVGGNITLTLNPNCLTGFCRTLTLVITNGGAYTITWPASVKWAGGSAPTFTASGVDIVTLITVDAGTTWYGSANGVSYA